MFKLPQLDKEQLAPFICDLFNQSLIIQETADFELEGDFTIHSSYYNITIWVKYLPITTLKEEAQAILKSHLDEMFLRQNLIHRTLVLVTNYAQPLAIQQYLDDLKLDYNAVYLDWEGISIFAGTKMFNLPKYYPDTPELNPPTEEDCIKGIALAKKILNESLVQSGVYRIILAKKLEEEKDYTKALNVLLENITNFEKISVNAIRKSSVLTFKLTYDIIAMLYQQLGDYELSIYWFERSIALYKVAEDASFMSSYTGLGFLHLSLGQYSKAIEVLNRAEKMLTTFSDSIRAELKASFYLLGLVVYVKVGDTEKALYYFKLIETEGLYPTTDILKQHYSQYYKQLESPENSILLKSLIEPVPSTYIGEPNEQQPYAIKQIAIKEFHCIKNIHIEAIPIDTQWIFITGLNGTGKTSFLQAIAAGLLGNVIDDYAPLEKENPKTAISVELLEGQEDVIYTFGMETNDWRFMPDSEKRLPILGYGPSRLRIQSESVKENRWDDFNVFSLFNVEEGSFINIEKWLKDETIKNRDKVSEQMKMVINTLCALMPSVTNISVDIKDAKVKYLENGVEVTINRLASGNKSILAMVGDMLIRLLRFFPKAEKTADFSGIILIDELDLHLHPSWQRELPWLLTDLFPNVQFICTTHSIIPFMGAPERSIFYVLERNEEEKGTTIKRLDEIDVKSFSANLLLSSPLFGVPLLSKWAENKGASILYRTEFDFEEYKKNVENSDELKNLQKKYGDIFGDNLFKK